MQNQKSSLIDHVRMTNTNKQVQTRQINSDSDHELIVITLLTRGKIHSTEQVRKGNFKNFNKEDY